MGNQANREKVKDVKDLSLDELKLRFKALSEEFLISQRNFEFVTAEELKMEMECIKVEIQYCQMDQ
jgi:hypothetical protein